MKDQRSYHKTGTEPGAGCQRGGRASPLGAWQKRLPAPDQPPKPPLSTACPPFYGRGCPLSGGGTEYQQLMSQEPRSPYLGLPAWPVSITGSIYCLPNIMYFTQHTQKYTFRAGDEPRNRNAALIPSAHLLPHSRGHMEPAWATMDLGPAARGDDPREAKRKGHGHAQPSLSLAPQLCQ